MIAFRLFAFAAFASLAHAATTTVTSLAALQTAINSAAPGDTIIVANGTYSASSSLTINKVGTAANPILIAAETVGGVTISGSRGFTFSSPAAYVTIQGFKLTHSSAISIPSGTSHCRLSRNIIELTIPAGSDVSYLNISGDDVEIDRNELRNKSTLGEMLDIAGSGSQVARRLWVHHNYFHDFKSPGGNGAETIRWGLSGLSLSNGFGLCEYNLFVRCEGENEMISNKSSSNTYRYNTVLDSPGGEISQRHGNDCLYYGNYMRNTQGIRVYGDRHQIFSNYLEGNSIAINMGNGDGDVYNGALLTAHDRPDDCVVVFNTLVNNTANYEMGGRTGGLGATHTTFANNLIVGGGVAVSISTTAPYTNPVWAGNLLWQTAGPGDLPAGSYTNADPLLVKDAGGISHLSAGSPAIDSAVGTYAAVTFDMDGQPRTAPLDVGADEFSAATITARLLTPADVGPDSGLTTTPVVVAPVIVTAPTSLTVSPNSTAVFTVTATGFDLVYQWKFNSTALANATSSTLVLPVATAAQAGDYTVTITNSAGSVTSTAATLAFSSNPSFGRLINLSILTRLTATDSLFTVGTVVGGAGTTGKKNLVIRAVGPSLAPFGLTDALPDPQLTVLSGAIAIATNDNWSGDPALATAMAQVGAFSFASATSKDAAVAPTLDAGGFTVQVSDVAGAAGSVLAELYDATPAAAFTAATPRLINVSVLKQIPAGATLTAGFVIGGATAKTVLVRAIGPGLVPFGIATPLGDPQLTLFSGSVPIATNDNWGGDPQLTAAGNAVGAFALASATSKDAVLLVTLAPGSYTAQIAGAPSEASAKEGPALVEIYEVP